MKARSFESQLRQAVPPAPDMDARLRARRAALAEFARVNSERDAQASVVAATFATETDSTQSADSVTRSASDAAEPASSQAQLARSAAERSRKSESLWSLGWPLKSAWLGGMATACAVLIGVSVVWLMPPRDRQINLNVTLQALEAAKSEVPATAGTASTQLAASALSDNAANAGGADPSAPTDVATVAQNRASEVEPIPPAPITSDRIQITIDPRVGPSTPARDSAAAQPSVAATASSSLAPAAPAAAVSPGSAGAAPEPSQELQENVVTGSRIGRSPASNSPTADTNAGAGAAAAGAATASANDGLSEVVIVEPRQKRGFFSRKASVPAPPPPAVAADEGRDKFQHFETNPVKRVSDDPVSTFSVDVDTAAYSFVRRKLNEGVLPQMDAVRVEEMINYFDYAWPTSDSRDQPFKPTITVSDSPWGKGKKLIHIGIKGYELPRSQQADVNLVLLLDVSGSMDSPDKLPLAQRSMALLLDSLRPTDTVAIVVYAGNAGQVLAPTPVRDKETILRAISALEPGGSTAGAEGIRLAYALAEKSFRKGGVNRILLATDGDFNVGITDQNELKSFVAREREKGVYLSVLGFGEGNYRDEMAQTLAQNGNGVAAYIDTLNEAKKVLVQEATSSLFPIAKDVKLQVEFNPATVAEYRLVGYETRALNREDFNNDKVDAGDVGSGHTVTAIYEITPVDSDAKLIDESRYAARNEKAPSSGKANEYGFLKIRYKLPNGVRSRLLEEPIRMDAGVPAALRDDVSFSTAVAGFGQLLRGSQYLGTLSFEDVIKQAQVGVGADPHGYRAEFVRLVSKAQQARGM